MKIYTKTGDSGQTSLFSGERVAKYHDRIEAYGTIDELNSFIGLLRSENIDKYTEKTIINIQNILFDIGTELAITKEVKFEINKISPLHTKLLEDEIDFINKNLPPLKNFTIPGGCKLNSSADICRTVCRRAERLVIKLADKEKISPNIIIYLNRLSDYFFVLSRKFLKESNKAEITRKNVKKITTF